MTAPPATADSPANEARLDEFHVLPLDEVRARLATCLAVPRWVDDVADGRPYADLLELRERAAASAAELTDEELDAALARHPRIGERPSAGHDCDHSRREQAGVDPADAELAARLVAGNRCYEKRFDRVFLIRAAGRSASEILTELDRRLENDAAAERLETITALREIALLRLDKVVEAT